jgi:hypothetical protein
LYSPREEELVFREVGVFVFRFWEVWMTVRPFKLELRSNQPVRVVGSAWGLGDERRYYGVTQVELARFLGVSRNGLVKWERDWERVPLVVVKLMAVLSQFPPVWVRNRLRGEVPLAYVNNKVPRRFNDVG